jgi:hypothetical protein
MKLTQIVQACFLSLAIFSQPSCSSLKVDNCLKNPMLSELDSQTEQVLKAPEIKAFYQEYFPNGKLELSHKNEGERIFLRPDYKKELGYSINFGIEIKY